MSDADADTARPALARHAVAVATVRSFAAAAHAARVVVLRDCGDGVAATLIEHERGGLVAITEGAETVVVPADALRDAGPLPLDPPRPVPATALAVDAEEGSIEAPLGALANLALAVLDLARAFGGRSVATADFETRVGGPLTIAAREGEPFVLALGEHQYELPEGWPYT